MGLSDKVTEGQSDRVRGKAEGRSQKGTRSRDSRHRNLCLLLPQIPSPLFHPSAYTMITTLLSLLFLHATALPDDYRLPPPPGPYAKPVAGDAADPSGFTSGKPLVATTYFCWYDDASKAHIVDSDGTDALTDHPPTLEGFSYNNVDWHIAQFRDMRSAGIDVAMEVYWGIPGSPEHYDNTAVRNMVAARKKMLAAGEEAPAIGMFYDTSTLEWNAKGVHVDLTTPQGKEWFYGTIRDFYSLVPPEHRATIDGKPLVFLYAAAFAKDVDDTLFPHVRKRFKQDFGTNIYLVKMTDWPGKADSIYQWGGALTPHLLETAAIGPGYDHSAVPGRTPLVRDREDGKFYAYAWELLLACDPKTRPWLVHVETWNEFHEGTDVCESKEHGRKYIELTKKYSDAFHAGERLKPTVPPLHRVSVAPGEAKGAKILENLDGDGLFEVREIHGEKAWVTKKNKHSEMRYLYFDVHPRFLCGGDEAVDVVVTYFDDAPGAFRLEYDSADKSFEGLKRQFVPTPAEPLQGDARWERAAFTLPRARFADGCNGGDFRIACGGRDLIVREITLSRRGAEKTQTYAVFPIGRVREKDSKKTIILDEKYVPATLGMKTGDRIWVIWWFDRNDTPEKRAVLQVHPRGNPRNPLRGIFATRSPMRPNLIALTGCKITAINRNIIEVEGLDAFDGTPVLDIKTAHELR